MRSKAHCEKIIEDGVRPTDCRDEPRSKVPFVRSPPMRSPGHIVHAKCDRRSFSFVSRKRMPRYSWMWFLAVGVIEASREEGCAVTKAFGNPRQRTVKAQLSEREV